MKSIVWVIAAGDEDKDLVPTMLKDGVMLVGPSKNIGDLAENYENKIANLKPKSNTKSALKCIKNRMKIDQLIVLRLGSVCFSVGAIQSKYIFNLKYSHVISFWNKNNYSPKEKPWSMQHTRKVNWYALNDERAIHYFRKGIYGSARRLYRLGDKGKKSEVAKSELNAYLLDLGYNNSNADEILKKIGKLTIGVNSLGFPV